MTAVSINIETITCGTCGIAFGVPDFWLIDRRKMGGDIHCPNGCRRVFGESEASKLRKLIEGKDRELRESKCEVLRQQQLRELDKAALVKAEAKLGRVARGVCSDCKRSFTNLARHMATKHGKGKPCHEA